MTNPAEIKCVAIDDELSAIKVIRHLASQVPYLKFVGGYISPVEGLTMARTLEADIVFLDIQMPEINGLDLLKHLPARCSVILTTAYSQYAIDGFNLDVTDYLLKPISLPRFLKAVEKARNQLLLAAPATAIETQPDFLLVKGDAKGKFIKVDYRDIDYIEGRKNYVAIICGQQSLLTLITIKELEEKLPADRFVRIHKSCIVSIDKIESIEGNIVRLKSRAASDLVIGNTYRESFFERMNGKTR